MVSVSLLLSSAWNYWPFQNWNLVQFISRWLYKAFYVIFISTALKYCTTVIWSSVCVLWDRHDTWKLKTGSLSGIQRGTGGEKGKKQWECAPRDQGGGKRGGKNRMRRQSHVILPRVKTAFISMKDNLHKFTALYNWTMLLYFRTGSKDWCICLQSFINNLQYSLLQARLCNCPCISHDTLCRYYIQGETENQVLNAQDLKFIL